MWTDAIAIARDGRLFFSTYIDMSNMIKINGFSPLGGEQLLLYVLDIDSPKQRCLIWHDI